MENDQHFRPGFRISEVDVGVLLLGFVGSPLLGRLNDTLGFAASPCGCSFLLVLQCAAPESFARTSLGCQLHCSRSKYLSSRLAVLEPHGPAHAVRNRGRLSCSRRTSVLPWRVLEVTSTRVCRSGGSAIALPIDDVSTPACSCEA